MKVSLGSVVPDDQPTTLADCSLPRTAFYHSGDLRILLKMNDMNYIKKEGDQMDAPTPSAPTPSATDSVAGYKDFDRNVLQTDDLESDKVLSARVRELVEVFEKLSQHGNSLPLEGDTDSPEAEAEHEAGPRLTFNIETLPLPESSNDRKSYLSPLLAISPAETLEFVIPEDNSDPMTTLSLTNTSENRVAYKIKCTNTERYDVHPSSNIILPGESDNVSVYLLHDGIMGSNKDKFQIIYMTVEPEVKASNVNYMFKTTSSKDYMQHRLKCKIVRSNPLVVTSADYTLPPNEMSRQLGEKMDQLLSRQESFERRVSAIQISVLILSLFLAFLCIAALVSYWHENLPVNKYTINACVPHYL